MANNIKDFDLTMIMDTLNLESVDDYTAYMALDVGVQQYWFDYTILIMQNLVKDITIPDMLLKSAIAKELAFRALNKKDIAQMASASGINSQSENTAAVTFDSASLKARQKCPLKCWEAYQLLAPYIGSVGTVKVIKCR
jgi:hypothetical protein